MELNSRNKRGIIIIALFLVSIFIVIATLGEKTQPSSADIESILVESHGIPYMELCKDVSVKYEFPGNPSELYLFVTNGCPSDILFNPGNITYMVSNSGLGKRFSYKDNIREKYLIPSNTTQVILVKITRINYNDVYESISIEYRYDRKKMGD